tara:strand:- start:1870 stop:2622 length:753 start_codon:yes stop_codon:yes gene_type:complete
MLFKKHLILLLFILSCAPIENISNNKNIIFEDSFSNSGFTLVFSENLKEEKIIDRRLDSRSLTIFQKNLKKGEFVKITNLLNNKSLIATVGVKANYPNFYNSVISERIYKELEIDLSEPYIEIYQINSNSTFVAKKAKTFDEEKVVANKAPIDGISIKDLNSTSSNKLKKQSKKDFKYLIKIANFYFEDTAFLMKSRILEETNIKKVNIMSNSSNSFIVFLGPFNDLNSLKNNFNTINKLNFENLELIKQ